MPYFESGSLRALEISTYASQALAFNTGRQPNVSNSTLVMSTVSIAQNANNEDGQVNFQISPDNATWTTIGEARSVGGAGLGTFTYTLTTCITALVPPTFYYRLQSIQNNGTITFAVVANLELTL